MAECPSCHHAVGAGDWFCPHCATQLQDASQIDQARAALAATIDGDVFPILDVGTFSDEVTSTLAWKRAPELLTGEALIVGELSGELELDGRFSTLEGVAPTADGDSQGLLLYADSSSTKLLSPSAVPRLLSLVPDDVLLTPYEEYLVTFINGRRTIRELQEAGLLAPEEMSVSVLTLVDRGLVTLAPLESGARLIDRTEIVRESDLAGLAEDLELPPVHRPEPSPIKLDPSALVPIDPTPQPAKKPLKRAEPQPIAPAPAPVAPPSKKQESKAADLFRASLRDRSVGNVISARMNLKIAIACYPGNREYQEAFRSMAETPSTSTDAPRPLHAAAAKLFDEAAKAEANGELDRTIRLLDRALQTSKEPVVMNRLGVILATRKHDYKRAQELLEAAVEIDPHNSAYVHNLGKVLSAAAVAIEAHKAGSGAASSKGRLQTFWDRLRGKKPKSRA